MSNQPFQTRDEQGGLEYWDTLKEAMAFAKDNPHVWKISFSVGEERVRLVRSCNELDIDNRRNDLWIYETLLKED